MASSDVHALGGGRRAFGNGSREVGERVLAEGGTCPVCAIDDPGG